MNVAAVVHDTEKLRELADVERQAWQTYRASLQDLTGDEYERAESDSWAQLQRELRQLARRRKTLTENST